MNLTAYQTVPPVGFQLTSASHQRDWMDATHNRSAYRCLPMLLANQAGWVIANPETVRIKWDGGATLAALEMQRWQPAEATSAEPDYVWPSSHFGSGIVTWTLPFLFRTPPGFNLLVRGPANTPKDGVTALEGLVETDWTAATFTMNWKITRADTWITFSKGEPLCMIVPQRRGELETFTPETCALDSNPELYAANSVWRESRDKFNATFDGGWEKHYFKGAAPDGAVASQHQTKLRLKQFKDSS